MSACLIVRRLTPSSCTKILSPGNQFTHRLVSMPILIKSATWWVKDMYEAGILDSMCCVGD